MSAEPTKRLNVVLCWHMHQPCYRSAADPHYRLPWVYLHAIKDYIDMAVLIESVPRAKVVVNFAPVLLEQIDDYAKQIRGFLSDNTGITDPLLAALAGQERPHTHTQQRKLIADCLRANEKRLIKRFKPYERLAGIAKLALEDDSGLNYITTEFLDDLLVWYHLAWLGETVRRESAVVKQLMVKAHSFNAQDRRQLLELMALALESVVPRYRKLAQSGQVELSYTPYFHPIVPLLLDFRSAREAVKDMPLPEAPAYPGGEQRALWHFEEGMRVFERYFQRQPTGCWPSEGSLSTDTVRLAHHAGIRWLASGENVMRNSIAQNPLVKKELEGRCIHRPYKLADYDTVCFFRDDGLSDLIGFTYSEWHADDAVNNLIHHLENIARACEENGDSVVSIILDGENAWEHYPENGFYFLTALYQRLSSHELLRMTTFEQVVAHQSSPVVLEKIVAGSWVYGTLSTWVGDKDKNRAWDLLVQAKQVYDRVMASGRLETKRRELATQQLAICEGSDWFWWFGDYNPANSVSDFDHLYRHQLKELYQLLGENVPDELLERISVGGGNPEGGGVMRKGS